MSLTGKAGMCSEERYGSELVADAAADDVQLAVEYGGDFFADEGGTLSIDGLQIDYTMMLAPGEPEDADILILAEPLPVAVEAGIFVSRMGGGQALADRYLHVSLGDLGDDVQVEVPFGEKDRWPLGIYDPPIDVVISDDQLRLEATPGRLPVIDGSMIDPSTLPDPSTPTDPPTASPTLQVDGFSKSLLVRALDPIDVSTLLTYQVATDAAMSNVVLTVADSRQTSVLLSPLTDGTDYYVRVTASNVAGTAAPSPVVGPVRTRIFGAADIPDLADAVDAANQAATDALTAQSAADAAASAAAAAQAAADANPTDADLAAAANAARDAAIAAAATDAQAKTDAAEAAAIAAAATTAQAKADAAQAAAIAAASGDATDKANAAKAQAVADAAVTAQAKADAALEAALTAVNRRVQWGTSAPVNGTTLGNVGDLYQVRSGTSIGSIWEATAANTWTQRFVSETAIGTLAVSKITGLQTTLNGLASDIATRHVITPIPTLTANSPAAGSIAWPAFTVKFGGVTYSVTASNTAEQWVIFRWNAGTPSIEKTSVKPTLAAGDLILFTNSDGIGMRVFATVLLDGDLLVDGSVTSASIATGAITAEALAADAITVDHLLAGDTFTQALTATGASIGGGTWDASKFELPGALLVDLVTRLATFYGDVVARTLTAEHLKVLGAFNTIEGILTLANGINPPAAPRLSVGPVPAVQLPPPTYGSLSQFAGLGVDGTTWVTAVPFYGGGFASVINKTTGAYVSSASMPANFQPYGGVVKLGSSYFVLGQDGNRSSAWYIYKFDSSWNKVDELLWSSVPSYSLTLGTDGTNLVIAARSDTGLSVSRRTNGFVAVGSSVTLPAWANATLTGVVWNDAGNRILLASTTEIRAFYAGSGARVTTDDVPRPSGNQVRGLGWDGTRLHVLDSTGKIHALAQRTTSTVMTATVTALNSAGTVRTSPSPVSMITLKAGQYLRAEANPLNDDGDPLKPKRVQFYVSAPTTRRAQGILPGPVGATPAVLVQDFDLPATGGADDSFTDNQFDAIGVTPGAVRSTVTDASGALIDMQGSGKWRLAGGGNDIRSDGTVKLANIQAGSITSPSVAAGTVRSHSITFSPPFAAPPSLTESVNLGASAARVRAWHWNVTTTGATILVLREDATGVLNVDWQAIGKTQ